MTRSLRPVDLLFTLGAIAFVAVLFGFQAASREVAGALGPLTVTEAVAFYSDELLLVRGYLVKRDGKTLLCELPRCSGAQLAVRGLGRSRSRGLVLLVGKIRGEGIVPASFTIHRQSARL